MIYLDEELYPKLTGLDGALYTVRASVVLYPTGAGD